jgi:alkanesulfonate monooxygenase SsuD/methylene tetrahydromethanopterin reductase-like flavin-dependent oxidoreductase (luciferase family)
MRFSINIPNFGDFANARTVATVAAAAEQAGWDALFVWDHVVHNKRQRQGQPFGDPWMLLTAAALATSRLRLVLCHSRWPGEGPSNSPARWPP